MKCRIFYALFFRIFICVCRCFIPYVSGRPELAASYFIGMKNYLNHVITPLENTQVGHPYKAVCDTTLCIYLIHNEVLILFSYLIYSPCP